jgi:hypothetical protein
MKSTELPFKFTESALAFIAGRGLTVETISGRIREDLIQAIDNNSGDFIFHTAMFEDDLDFFIVPNTAKTELFVDSVVWVEMDKLTEGPMAGKIVKMPHPSSEVDDDR